MVPPICGILHSDWTAWASLEHVSGTLLCLVCGVPLLSTTVPGTFSPDIKPKQGKMAYITVFWSLQGSLWGRDTAMFTALFWNIYWCYLPLGLCHNASGILALFRYRDPSFQFSYKKDANKLVRCLLIVDLSSAYKKWGWISVSGVASHSQPAKNNLWPFAGSPKWTPCSTNMRFIQGLHRKLHISGILITSVSKLYLSIALHIASMLISPECVQAPAASSPDVQVPTISAETWRRGLE